jgi:hypothetical protein
MLVHNDREIILTFTLFGTSVSAMRFRRPGSILRQWREDMLIAISDSSLFNSEFINGSAPVVEKLNSAQKNMLSRGKRAVEQSPQVEIGPPFEDPFQLCPCDDTQNLQMQIFKM